MSFNSLRLKLRLRGKVLWTTLARASCSRHQPVKRSGVEWLSLNMSIQKRRQATYTSSCVLLLSEWTQVESKKDRGATWRENHNHWRVFRVPAKQTQQDASQISGEVDTTPKQQLTVCTYQVLIRSFALDNPKPAEISHVRSWTEHMRFGRVVMWKRTVSNATEWNYRKGICSGESSVQFELGEVCHAKSQFGLATRWGYVRVIPPVV